MTDDDQAPVFSAADKLREIEREIGARRLVYPSLIARGTLSAGEAKRRISVLRDIARDYREQIK